MSIEGDPRVQQYIRVCSTAQASGRAEGSGIGSEGSMPGGDALLIPKQVQFFIYTAPRIG
jgi:hypothetical protein